MLFKKQNIFFFLFTATILLLPLSSAFALELTYPPLLGLGGGPNAFFDLPSYILYFFWFLIVSSGGIGIISIAISGFKILLSFGKPEAIGEARKNIVSVILGLTLLMTSYIILNTINPEITNPVIPKLPPHAGVYLVSSTGRYIQAPKSAPNTSAIPLPGIVEIFHYCPDGPGKNLLVWTYNLPNFKLNGYETTSVISCGERRVISGNVLSFTHDLEDEGVYFYTTSDCSGYRSNVQKSSGEIKFNRQATEAIKSIGIVNGFSRDKRYGFLLNTHFNGNGECSQPYIEGNQGNYCIKAPDFPKKIFSVDDFNPKYAYIFKIDKIDPAAPGYDRAKNEVKLFSKNFVAKIRQSGTVDRLGRLAPNFNIGQGLLYKPFPQNGDPNNITGDPNNIIRDFGEYYDTRDDRNISLDGGIYMKDSSPFECCTKDTDTSIHSQCKENPDCTTGCAPRTDPNGSCLKDIVFGGKYYVVLYANEIHSGEMGCSIFTENANDINTMKNLFKFGKTLYNIAIIPRY